MLSKRALPPQFLLLAWSAQQLTGLAQRAYSSTDGREQKFDAASFRIRTWRDMKNRREQSIPSDVREAELQEESRIIPRRKSEAGNEVPGASMTSVHVAGAGGSHHSYRRLNIAGAEIKTTLYSRPGPDLRQDQRSQQNEASPKTKSPKLPTEPRPFKVTASALSLFDELFPEQRHTKTAEQRLSEHRFDKLPAFNWSPGRLQKAEERGPYSRHDDLQRAAYQEAKNTQENPGVLVLNACSKTLEQSDFFRLSPKGEHIEGWKSGLLKVIPSRDNKTLEPLGAYFLLFTNNATARAYLDQTMRLHKLTKLENKRMETKLPLPPGYLKEGEELEQLLRGFSLVPGLVNLSMKMLERPHSPRMQELIKTGGPVTLAKKEANAEHLVLFTLEYTDISHDQMSALLGEDGLRRHMQWEFVRDRTSSIMKLGDNQSNSGGPRSRAQHHRFGTYERNYHGGARFVLSMKDAEEAKRFVREWHRRPLPAAQGRQHWDEDDDPPIVNAEVLW